MKKNTLVLVGASSEVPGWQILVQLDTAKYTHMVIWSDHKIIQSDHILVAGAIDWQLLLKGIEKVPRTTEPDFC